MLPAEMLKLISYAKINLSLEVLGKRADGYHQICSILQTVDLADKLAFQDDSEVNVTCNVPALSSEENLVTKAAMMLKDRTGCTRGASIRLTKGIPLASGLGGGSSDAATTLIGLNLFWELGLSSADLLGIAASIGSDVPFFLYGGTALAEGRGELIRPLPYVGDWWVVLVKPPAEIARKTARLYASLEPTDFTSGESTQMLAIVIRDRKELNHRLLRNSFDRAAFHLFPALNRYKDHLLAAGASHVSLSGSGPAIFSLFKERTTGEAVYEKLRLQGMKAYLIKTVGPTSRTDE
ncbi:MAG: 4-(cytidine 5'-diphospho)-2-C-methyl-D-erythritol kinase [Chloroflexota bacterium]